MGSFSDNLKPVSLFILKKKKNPSLAKYLQVKAFLSLRGYVFLDVCIGWFGASPSPCLVYILSFLSIRSPIFVPWLLLSWGLLSDCTEPISGLSAPLGRKLGWLLERFQWSLISGNIFALRWKVMEAETRLSCNLGHCPLFNSKSLNLCSSSNRINHFFFFFFFKLLSILYLFISLIY